LYPIEVSKNPSESIVTSGDQESSDVDELMTPILLESGGLFGLLQQLGS